MGCLRLGFSFLIALFAAAIFTGVGIVFGSIAYIFLVSHGSSSHDISSPMGFMQINSPGALIGGGIGATIGLLLMISIMRRAADVNWLKRSGTHIMATVTEIKQERRSRQVSSYSNNQTQTRTEWYSVYIIVARWTDPKTQIIHTFTSSDLTFRPQKFHQGSSIEVLIDPDNMKRYYLET